MFRPPALILLLFALVFKEAWSSSSSLSRSRHSTSSTRSTATTATTTTDFIDCNLPCNDGDVNYELTASVRIVNMTLGNTTYRYRGRTYSNSSATSDGNSNSDSNSNSLMGPTMRVAPGQSLNIKLINRLTSLPHGPIGPTPPSPLDYWNMLNHPGEHIKYQRYKQRVKSHHDLKVDLPNMPHEFDDTNLHLHGLDVQVHMFDPVNTHNPLAPHVRVKPNQCYCYRFDVPEDHPEGMYWYHPHLHGSTAIQLWSGMMGLIYVEKEDDSSKSRHYNDGDNDNRNENEDNNEDASTHTSARNEDEDEDSNSPTDTGTSFRKELERYQITNTHEFVLWDPAFQEVHDQNSHNLQVDEFLLGQTTLSKIHPFLINGEINPTFTTSVHEVLHFRALCATIENENTFIIYPEGKEHLPWKQKHDGTNLNAGMNKSESENVAVPFYIIGSDGVMYERPIKKSIIVMSGGQREEILVKFEKAGRYVISQQGIQGMQFFDMRGHPHDQILATIVVTDDDSAHTHTHTRAIDIRDMRFTPGYKPNESIQAKNIASSETIIFSMGANFDQVPFPQYYVNGHPFRPEEIRFHAQPGEAREYTIINANHNAHPFHIHVNRFQVKEMGSELSLQKYPVLESVLDFDEGIWRDSVMVPPNGRVRIWVQFKNYTGKTVIHCHFLAHEDTGMMATLFIGEQDWVFRLEEHIQWMVGGIAGILLTSLIMFVYMKRLRKGGSSRMDDYSVVAMNDMKAKAMD